MYFLISLVSFPSLLGSTFRGKNLLLGGLSGKNRRILRWLISGSLVTTWPCGHCILSRRDLFIGSKKYV